ncbi:50S ribosomal protein L23 [Candidatus Micrarchaeota archaeon]|nr:50S ribosomal protein L23 [Candidatus Micrarchaeota archaeon]
MVVILYPLTTEKGVGAIEKENKITLVVTPNATKKQVKEEFEKFYGEKVKKITMLVAPDGRKKAVISLERKGAASDVAAKLKVI